MTIKLEYVVPSPLAEWDNSQSEVWASKLTLNQGEVIQVVAPSGRGKSTLMHVLYGNRTDYTGTLFFNEQQGKSMSHAQWAAMRQRRISMVFQDLRLFPDFTGYENLQLKNRLTETVSKDQIQQYTERLGVAGLLKKKCGFMSFGERQRYAIIRALLQPFDWLLLDEPFSHLDENNIRKASQLIIEEAKKRNAGVIVASLGSDIYFDYTKKIQL
ncbi:MAG: ATP-binding cassette domain-containing protein [Chitinophagales bacterium]|nr:ATP-binding cassette domain-containing protein [Chitinophagales bacterium]